MAEAAAQIPEPFNVHAWLVKPSGFGAGVTFTQDRKLLVLEAEWEWLAKGGSGPAMFKVEGDLGDPDTYVTDGWEIILDLRLQPEVNYTRWYRGRIVDVKAAVVASKTVTSIRVQGQWASEATAVKLDNDYTAGNQDVKTIIGDILDNQGVDTETRIVYDASLIAASTYTPATFDAVGSASRVIAALAETQGSREFDIDPDTRKFRMAAEVTTVPERNVYIVGKDVKELDAESVHNQIVENISKLFYKANLIHSDLSEYNMLYWNEKIYFIDIGQGILRSHPKAREFFERDLHNTAKFLRRIGYETDFDSLYAEIKQKSSDF